MRTGYLQEFVMLVDTMSYTEAAKRLYLTQSALSKHISSLEKELGAELVTRTATGLSLTEAGKVFYEDAKTILNDCRKAIERVDAVKRKRDSLIRIGYLRDAALPLLVPLTDWFKRHHPDVELRFLSSEYQKLPEALDSHRVDAIITMDADEKIRDRCRAVPLYPDTFIVALSQRHPLAGCSSLTLNDLHNETLLVPSKEIWPQIRGFIDERCPAEMRERFRQIEDVDTLFFMVGSGQGSAIVSSHNRFAYGSTVAFIPLDEPDIPQFPVSALWLKDQPNPSSERTLELLEPAFKYARETIPKE